MYEFSVSLCLTQLKTLAVFSVVVTGVLMKSENVYVGTVGETVDIKCQYPDDHRYTPKYFCRHPCKSSVLIKSAKIDQVVSDGRYSLIDFVSGRFFTVTIKHLRLTDSDVYYCGLDQWFRDTLNQVQLSVRPDNSHSYEPLPSTVQSPGSTPPVNSSSVNVTAVCAGVLLFLVFWILVASVCIYSRRSDAKSRYTAQEPPDFNQAMEDICTMVVYSLDDPPKEDCSSLNYSTTLLHVTQ
ncbi:CMRF-35-like molecule 4 [Onychostoma macrolepis]|uniref:CMRF-35-like molecule 4 n=1 Tax=Onychostoma macrolepis TaxID=369639 RepID=UPI00272B5D14|nr:CMRF-35-like molecule 4 [Onychostoma macrolepis]